MDNKINDDINQNRFSNMDQNLDNFESDTYSTNADANYQRIDALLKRSEGQDQPVNPIMNAPDYNTAETTASIFGATPIIETESTTPENTTMADASQNAAGFTPVSNPTSEALNNNVQNEALPTRPHVSAGSIIVEDAELQAAKDKKKQKIRFIASTAVVASVVLGLAVWGIVAMVSSRNRVEIATNDNTTPVTTAAVRKKDEEEIKAGDATSSTEGVKEVVAPTAPAAPVEAHTGDNIPQTGPEEILPFAMLTGSLVAYVGSSMVKAKENQ